jgi:hypothetical protein
MSRILTHLTVAVLGLAPLAAGAKSTSIATADQTPSVACVRDCAPSDCPTPSCCGGCGESCEMSDAGE